ncbi:predicted protein [Naegleria gruberi]|uniref:Predicted protein n=1 Tax=Naegleria gruberi TaxID=5762 RepID=D2VEQ2_NAEGR|nr:uncharacterized protein NAEGRDRAFT_67353 [Naegleria gruberi]EFC44547.1 predicted protein [Naegleria gruberi]|eukprot:XP_002677291.1 predicted protein [Naegleria gruberi strain NEG-M]
MSQTITCLDLVEETLKVNLDHFLRNGQVEECFERSRYDQFLSFLDKNIFNQVCQANSSHLFISKAGLYAIYNTLFVLNKSEESSPILCMKRCMIITLGMFYRNEGLFNEHYWTLPTNEKIENNLFKNYMIEMLRINESSMDFTMNLDDVDFLKTSIFNSLCTFLDCHNSSMNWFTNEIDCFETIFKHNIKSENIYLRQACIQCLLLVSQYWYQNGKGDFLIRKILDLLEPFKKENILEYLEFILQLVTLSFNDHNNTFDFTMMRPLSTTILQEVLLQTKLIEILIQDDSISETHDLRVVERLYDILIYLSNHSSVENSNSLLKLSGPCDSIGHTIEIIQLCLLSNDNGFQEIGIKIISNFSKEILFIKLADKIIPLMSILINMWKSLINPETNSFTNFTFMSMKQKGKFILGITKCLTRFINDKSISNLFEKMALQNTIIETARLYDHINNPLCSKVFELLYSWSYHSNIQLDTEHSNYLWFLFHNTLVPKTFTVVSKIIPLVCLDEEQTFAIVSDRCLDMNWEIRDSVIDFLRFIFIESNNHPSFLKIANYCCEKQSDLLKLIDQKLVDKEHFVVLMTFKALYSMILFMVNSKKSPMTIQFLIKIFETANQNTEYFIKKEAIEICKNLIVKKVITLTDILENPTMVKCISTVVEFSSMECDVEVANQFLQLSNVIINLQDQPIAQVLQFLIEINSTPVIKEYFENTMVESNNNLSISIIANISRQLSNLPLSSPLLNHSFCEFIQSCHTSLHHHDNHHEHVSLVQDFFNFDNDDYDCQCC